MKEICKIDKCTGCGLCYAMCPKECISFTKTYNGHVYPVIDENDCINCNKCVNNCIANQDTIIKNNARFGCYAAWCRNEQEHYESASAGLATTLSRSVLRQGGKVYGCAWNEKLEAVHIGIDKEEDLNLLRKSKYTLSHISKNLYEDIKVQVSSGRLCLFIGVGCQCDAVRKYVGGNHNNLIIIDLLCHGGASPLLLKKHVEYLVQRYKLKDVNNITFRGGDYDCRIALRHNNDVLYWGGQYQDEYFLGFMSHVIFRKSCFICNYASSDRVGDITLADFWGLDKKLVADYNFLKRGVNLVLVNTEKGKMLFDSIVPEINTLERELSEAVDGNETLQCATPVPSEYDVFWKNMKRHSFEKSMHVAFKKEYRRIRLQKIIRIILFPLIYFKHHFFDKYIVGQKQR